MSSNILLLRGLLAVVLALSLIAAGCGEDDEPEAEPTPQAAQTSTPEPTPEPADEEALKDLESKPPVVSPGGDPPAELVEEDIVKGDGRRARSGDQISVQYVGVSYSTGEEFDASWDRGEPFVFQLGAGQVIPGWDEGVAGMREGGRRQLTIPPDMAYGAAGAPPAIGPDETLIFVVDLVEVG